MSILFLRAFLSYKTAKKIAVKYHKKLLRNMKVFVDIDYRIGYNNRI